MNRYFGAMVTAVLLLCVVGLAEARMVHNFDCANCHKPTASLDSVTSNVCIGCHTSAMKGTKFPFSDGSGSLTNPIGDSVFAPGDASDALGSVTAQSGNGTPGDQTSHNWASLYVNSKAGATAPSDYRFYGRRNYSHNKLTCSRCHEPHAAATDDYGPGTANPKLLKLGAGSEAAMCKDCHVNWASETAPSEGGATATNLHPMVTDYATVVAGNNNYKSAAEVASSAGEVTLSNGGIDCLTCHGVHFTDSDSSTLDGVQAGSLGHLNPNGRSRGKILRANGPAFDEPNIAGDSICQSCHKYNDHGSTQLIGCLVCHGAHIEDTGGQLNNYMLRDSVTTYLPKDAATGTVTGLSLNAADAINVRLWNYCFTCHDSATAAIAHDSSWTCSDCHSHSDVDGSWAAAGACNNCHGYPPSQNVASDRNGGNAGYAVQADATSYADSGHFKDESQTKHAVHAGGGSDYSFSCSACHKNNDHIGKTYADVFLAPYNSLIDAGGALTPSYTAATGSCGNLYCHSNGNPRSNGSLTVNNPGVWENGAAITTCDACHGNDATDMATRNNSATHIAHLNKGYSCQVCHSDTAVDQDNLKLNAGAPPTTHVDGTTQVVFNDASVTGVSFGATSYGTDGTCSVYCHSNGTTNVAPDWDAAASGACGTCHQYSNAGVATGSGAALGGAHSVHLFDAGGPQIASCDTCHTHNGTPGAANTTHVNGSKDLVAGACDACHGSDGSSTTGNDRIPVWTDSASVDCETCHAGSVIADITGSVTTPAVSYYGTAGHGKAGIGAACSSCHDPAADSNHIGALGDTTRLRNYGGGYVAANSKPFCGTCHPTQENHYSNANSVGSTDTSTDGDNCVICHDPHGQQDKNSADLDAMIRADINGRVVTGFTDKTARASYYATGGDLGEGVCQTCHDPNEVNNFNRTTANTSHGGAGVCTSCHQHTSSPAFKASCNGCHGDTTSGQYWPDGDADTQIPTANQAGRHDLHVLAIGQRLGYGDYSVTMYSDAQQKAICEYCHAATSNDSDHGLVGSLPADVFVAADASRHAKSLWGANDADAAYNAGNDTCSNIDCHNSKLTTDGSYGWYDAATSSCIMCHNDITDTGIATGQTHAAHTGAAASYGRSIDCATCHDAATNWGTNTKPANNHIDGSFDISGSVSLTYTGSLPPGSSFGSCGTNACHEDGKGGTPVVNGYTWGTAEASACGICHATSMATAAHDEHLAVSSYVTGCTSCHTAATAATHLNDTVNFDAAKVAYASGTGTCSTNVCHSNGDWRDSNPTPYCTDCHADAPINYIGPNPTTGLHNPTNAQDHKDPFNSGSVNCKFCHNDPPTAKHLDGALQNPDSLGAGYTWQAAMYSYDRNVGCATACHKESIAWSRKWIGVVDAKPQLTDSPDDPVCDNCHGDFDQDGAGPDTGWRSGVSARHSDDVQIEAGHADSGDNECYACHAWGTAEYAARTSTHPDSKLQLNFTGAGGVDNGATVGCGNCHVTNDGTADGQHEFVDTDSTDSLGIDRWLRDDTGGPVVNCTSCHVANGVDHGGATENDTLHSSHINSGYVSGCTDCHSNGGPGNADHDNGTVNFNNVQLSNSEDYLKTDNFSGTCATNSCHDSDAGEWAAGNLGGDSCTDCHAATGKLLDQGGYPPTSGEHSQHLGNDAIFAPASDCDQCHGAGAVSGSHTGHKDKAANITLANQISSYASGDCTNSCHTAAAAGSDDWTAGVSLSCADCHNKAGNSINAPIDASLSPTVGPSGDKHSNHVGADSDYVGAATCTTCHGHSGALGSYASTGHVDGVQKSFDSAAISLFPGDGSCTNSCHLAADAGDWSTSGALACTDCHTRTSLLLGAGGDGSMSGTVAPATGKHSEHMAISAYVTGCTDCHSHNGSLAAAGHVNGPNKSSIETSNKISSMTGSSCSNSCHTLTGSDRTASTGDDASWSAANPLACSDCHAVGQTGLYDGGAKDQLPISGLHDPSVATNHIGESPDCSGCHLVSNPSTSHMDGTLQDASAGTPYNFAGTISYTQAGGCTASCHADGGAWGRKWVGAADAQPQLTDLPTEAVCGNCHGTFGDWRTGVSASHAGATNSTLAVNHDNPTGTNACYLCHGWGDASYTGIANVHNSGKTLHVNDNASVGYVDNGQSVGCSNCHSSSDGVGAGTHEFEDTRSEALDPGDNDTDEANVDLWTRVNINGPDGNCDTCHDDNISGGAHNSSNENATLHTVHLSSPYIDTEGNFVDGSVATYDNCNTCHGHNGSGATHRDDTVDFAGSIDPSYSYAKGTGFGGSCATSNGCHDSDAGEWKSGDLSSGGDDACQDCHGATQATFFEAQVAGLDLTWSTATTPNGPSTVKHDEHLGSSYMINCSDCHNHSGSLAAGTRADHANKSVETSVSYVSGTQTCTNSCHIANTTGDWSNTGSLACDDCHGAANSANSYYRDRTSGSHPQHVDTSSAPTVYGNLGYNSSTTQYDFACGECHPTNTANHLNGGAVEIKASVSYNGSSQCSNVYCHSYIDTSNTRQYQTTPAWGGSFAGDSCSSCHGNSPVSNAHAAHEVGFHYNEIYSGLTGFLPVNDNDCTPGVGTGGCDPGIGTSWDRIRGHGGTLSDGTTATSTVMTCNVCHWSTVTVRYNAANSTCSACHTAVVNPTDPDKAVGNAAMVIADKSVHVDGNVDVAFFPQKVRSKAQLRNDLADVPEVSNNWSRINGYKQADGSSYDEQPDTLVNMSTWTSADQTCTSSCHLWEAGRVDKNPVDWVDNSQYGSNPLMCIDCHTRLPQ